MTTDNKQTYKFHIELPDGIAYSMAWVVDDLDRADPNWQAVFAKRVAYRLETIIRNETPEQMMNRISKEYEDKVNAV